MRGLTLVVSVECSLILEANLIINKPTLIGIRIALTYYSKSTHQTKQPPLLHSLKLTLEAVRYKFNENSVSECF